MKHLHTNTATATAMLTLIVLAAAGCSESTSRSRHAPTLASAPTIVAEPVVEPAAPAVEVVAEAPAPAAVVADAPVAVAPAAPVAAANLEVLQLVMARGVANHQPVAAAEAFTPDGRPLYAYMRVANSGSRELEVMINYVREDGLTVGPAYLTIPASSRGYRTFTRTSWVRHPGQWQVTVSTTDGTLLSQSDFTINS